MASADFLSAVEKPGSKRRKLVAACATSLIVAAAVAFLRPGELTSRVARVLGVPDTERTTSSRGLFDSQSVAGVAPAATPPPPAETRDGAAASGEESDPSDVAGASSAVVGDVPGGAAPEKQREALRARPLAECLSEIARQAGRGLILAPDISGEAVAAFAENTAWQERLAALARVHGFQYTVHERLIEAWVRPRAENGAPAAEARAKGEPTRIDASEEKTAAVTLVGRPIHARAADLVNALSKAARASNVQVSADPGSNAVVIAGPDAAAAGIADVVRALDVPRRRFVLEAEIVELSHKARQALGVRWSIDGTLGGIVNFPASDGEGEGAAVLVATDGAHALRARIGALAADGDVKVISRPRVVVLEGRPASIESVRILRVRFPDQTAIVGEANDGQAVSGGRAVEEIPVGITLRVEPSMQGDGKIVLRIRAKSSTLGPPQPPDNIPEELSRMVDAEVAVADGETAVLGGLMRQGSDRSGAGVPVLRSVPMVGLLFGKREYKDEDEELVVLVTPKLLPP